MSLITDMYGLHEGPSHAQLDRVREDYVGRIPEFLLAIGCDPGGNEVCIGLAEEQRERIYFWDHETGAIEELATAFAGFLDALFEWTDPNEHEFSRICRIHDMNVLQEHIDSGVDLESTDEHGRTLLEYAAMCGHVDMIERLYTAGASLRNARYYAERNENAALVSFLDSLKGKG